MNSFSPINISLANCSATQARDVDGMLNRLSCALRILLFIINTLKHLILHTSLNILYLVLLNIFVDAPLCHRVNGELWERKLSRDHDVELL